MAKSSTNSFVTEIPLVVDSKQEKELLSRFQAGRQLYNALLSESVARLELVRKSLAYQRAKNTPRGNKKERNSAFAEARIDCRYSEYDLHSYAALVAKSSKWIAEKLDAQAVQKLATRAFLASERVMLGLSKKVRFKVPSRFRSIEGKTNKQGIRWVNNQLVWGKLKINAKIEADNPVIQHGLSASIKYVRIMWRDLKGQRRWYAQLVNEGEPYQKPQNCVADGLVGLDLNISNIAFVGDKKAGLLPFAEKVPTYEGLIKALQRQMQRSQRANNPENFHPDFESKRGRKLVSKKGKHKKGNQRWIKSKQYQKSQKKKRELERRKAAYAQSQNRKIVNDILRHGSHIKTEKISVKGWQKRYGKAISAKSPGFVQSELKRKAEKAGGSFSKFSTRKTALSQTHLDGTRIKKSLSQRVHKDVTGVVMHRDLFSAFLSRHVNDEDNLLLHLARDEWGRLEPILTEAWKEFQQSANRVSASESGLCHSPLERISVEDRTISQIAIKGEKLI